MSDYDQIKIWENKDYQNSPPSEKSELANNPVGEIMSESELQAITGGRRGMTKKPVCEYGTYGVSGGRKCSKKGGCRSC